MLNIENIIERLKDIILQEDDNILREELDNLHFADIAEIFEELEEDERFRAFNVCWIKISKHFFYLYKYLEK